MVISVIAVWVTNIVRGLVISFLSTRVRSSFDVILLVGLWFVVFFVVEALLLQWMMRIRFTYALQVSVCTTVLAFLVLLLLALFFPSVALL